MNFFNAIVGNPPYQENAKGDSSSDDPIYHLFMDIAFDLSDKVSLITPARFLFNAGKTPKEWNQKVLNDPHFKVIWYKSSSEDVFPNVDIKGGVAVTFRDRNSKFGKIKLFTHYSELKSINSKVQNTENFNSITSIIETQNKFNLEELYKDYPQYKEIIGSDGNDKRLRQIIMERLDVFTKNSTNQDEYKILGLIQKKRDYRYIPKKYIEDNGVINKYKVFVPSANGSGAIGEVLSTPLIGEPLIGITQTFISFGSFETRKEAEAMLKYVKTKFARVLLGILKITQGNNRDVWEKVPLQNFTTTSHIDWSKSIPEIDQQLYRKYGLTEEEIGFIESMIKPMK
jgi:hypothetical protein